MAFPARCIRFGQFEVQPVQNVELSKKLLRIVFRADESTDSITFEIAPWNCAKTVYGLSETSTKILFRVLDQQFESIKTKVSGLFDASKETGKLICCVRFVAVHCMCVCVFLLQEKYRKLNVG